MFKPLPIFIGLRYTRANRDHQFISFISLMSILGIALGVTVLITVLSVLNGFDREIKKSIFSMMTPITVSSIEGHISNWQTVQKDIQSLPDIVAAAPFISGQALLQNSTSTQPVMVIGILPGEEEKLTALANKITAGKLSNLKANHFGIVLGEELATHLKVKLGDELIAMTSKDALSTRQVNGSYNKLSVVGLFHAGGGSFGYDSKLAFIHLKDAQKIFALGSDVTALKANIKNIYTASQVSQQLENKLSPLIRVTNWTEQLGSYFENIKLTKTIMFFIFILIIFVAVFNLIGTLIMVVNNKQSDIAILRTMGATPKMIMAIFVVQGAVIGFTGTVFGVAGGILLAWKVTAIVNLIQQIFNIQLISSNVYFVNYLPSELQWHDIWRVSIVALLLSLLATLRPAWKAARMDPAEALRYE